MLLAMVGFCQNWKHSFPTENRHFEAQIFHVKTFDTCFASSLITWPEKGFITGQNSQVGIFFSIWGLCPCIRDDISPHLYLLHPGECPYSIIIIIYIIMSICCHCTAHLCTGNMWCFFPPLMVCWVVDFGLSDVLTVPMMDSFWLSGQLLLLALLATPNTMLPASFEHKNKHKKLTVSLQQPNEKNHKKLFTRQLWCPKNEETFTRQNEQ